MVRKLKRLVFWLTIAVSPAAVVDQLMRPAESRTWHGAVWGVPYDFRPPTLERLQRSWWNPEDPRLFTPRAFGVGWDLNLYRLMQIARSRTQRLDSGG
jgi:hypothetical protein